MPMDMMNDDRASSANTTNPSPALNTHSPAVRSYEPQTVPLPGSSDLHLHHDVSQMTYEFDSVL